MESGVTLVILIIAHLDINPTINRVIVTSYWLCIVELPGGPIIPPVTRSNTNIRYIEICTYTLNFISRPLASVYHILLVAMVVA